jgi:hypothetical protein
MRKTLPALAAAAAIVVVTVGMPTEADAHRRRGGAVAAGVIGGIAAGALIGSALANPHYYGPGPVYVAPAPVYVEPTCHLRRERFWDGYGWRVRTVEVC